MLADVVPLVVVLWLSLGAVSRVSVSIVMVSSMACGTSYTYKMYLYN